MERIFITLSLWTTLVFADSSALLADSVPAEQVELAKTTVPFVQIDFMTTGTRTSTMPQGILHQLDACSADCQAERLGLVFED